MAIRRDRDDAELTALLDLVGAWAGLRVLEVGCGNGRLTRRYADLAAHVDGIDPAERLIEEAVVLTSAETHPNIAYYPTPIEQFRPPEKYDLAILSWSL